MAGFISDSTTKAKKNFFAGKFICFAGTITEIKTERINSLEFTTIETTDLNKPLQIIIRFTAVKTCRPSFQPPIIQNSPFRDAPQDP